MGAEDTPGLRHVPKGLACDLWCPALTLCISKIATCRGGQSAQCIPQLLQWVLPRWEEDGCCPLMMVNDKNTYPPLRTSWEEASSLICGKIWPQDIFDACGTLGLEKVWERQETLTWQTFPPSTAQTLLGSRALVISPFVRAQHRARAGGSLETWDTTSPT